MSDEIRTERLRLRRASEDDLGAFHAILSDPRCTAYWSTPAHRDVEQTRAWLRDMIEIQPEEGEDFVVEHRGRAIGKAGFFRFPEIGFIFEADSWGRGLASEALTALLDRVFDQHRLEAAEADVDPRNLRSLTLLGRLGFAEYRRAERTWQIEGVWSDSLYLRLSGAQWKRRSEDAKRQ